MTARACNVCGSFIDDPLYRSTSGRSITSLCEIVAADTVVWFCSVCGHLSTDARLDTETFYADQYRIFLDSVDEDNLYDVIDGESIYRTDHQVTTLLTLVDPPPHARVLDFGCAKGLFMRKLKARRGDLEVHLFDVSDMYRSFWDEFVLEGQTASFELPLSWHGSMDVVVTSFSLEHMEEPNRAVTQMADLLRTGGILYGLVPDTFANPADFVVIDHVNHFTMTSIDRLLAQHGLVLQSLTATAHQSALVFTARKTENSTPPLVQYQMREVTASAHELARYWDSYSTRVRELEAASPGATTAIYGAGFYGTMLASALGSTDRLECFVDRDTFRQGKQLLGRPIVAPSDLPDIVETIYVGLNPAVARRSIDTVIEWRQRDLEILYP
jgi:SAM-dependent methyltransferase